MAQKIAVLLCLGWLFTSPWWLKAMEREPNGIDLLLGGLYAALLAYPMWVLFGRRQLVLTLIVFGFLRLLQAPHLFAMPRTLGDTAAMAELMSAVLVMTLTVGALQWCLGHPPRREAAP